MYLLMDYNDLRSMDDFNRMSMPEFRLRERCRMDVFFQNHGIDPEKRPHGSGEASGDERRKMSKEEFVALLNQQIQENRKKEEQQG